MAETKWIGTETAAKMLNKTDRQVRRYCRDGHLASKKEGKHILVDENSVNALLQNMDAHSKEEHHVRTMSDTNISDVTGHADTDIDVPSQPNEMSAMSATMSDGRNSKGDVPQMSDTSHEQKEESMNDTNDPTVFITQKIVEVSKQAKASFLKIAETTEAINKLNQELYTEESRYKRLKGEFDDLVHQLAVMNHPQRKPSIQRFLNIGLMLTAVFSLCFSGDTSVQKRQAQQASHSSTRKSLTANSAVSYEQLPVMQVKQNPQQNVSKHPPKMSEPVDKDKSPPKQTQVSHSQIKTQQSNITKKSQHNSRRGKPRQHRQNKQKKKSPPRRYSY